MLPLKLTSPCFRHSDVGVDVGTEVGVFVGVFVGAVEGVLVGKWVGVLVGGTGDTPISLSSRGSILKEE